MSWPSSVPPFDNTQPVDRLEAVLQLLQTELAAVETSLLGSSYAENTFTPAMTINGSVVGITFTTQLGRYTKNGRQIHAEVELALSNKGASVGSVLVTGLPFTAATINNAAVVDPVANWVGLTSPPYVVVNGATGVLLLIDGAGNRTQVQNTNLTNTSIIKFAVTYSI